MEKVRPWCGQPSDLGRLKNRNRNPLEKFLFKKGNDNVCELKGGRPVNGIASELPMQKIGTFIVFF